MTSTLFQRILVPHDFSEAADQALLAAAALAADHGGRLHVLNVLEPVQLPANVALPTPMPHLFEFVPGEREALTKRVTRVLGPSQPPTTVSVEIGTPFERILEAADDADAIVMTTHGRSGLRRLLMGSVAERVVRLSPIPVLTIRAEPAAPKARRGGRRRAA